MTYGLNVDHKGLVKNLENLKLFMDYQVICKIQGILFILFATGCGKTHYIKNKIRMHENEAAKERKHYKGQHHVSVSINETFNRNEMFKLLKASLQKYGMFYYYNISLFLPEVSLLIKSIIHCILFRMVTKKIKRQHLISWCKM